MSAFHLDLKHGLAFITIASDSANTLQTSDFLKFKELLDQLDQDAKSEKVQAVILTSAKPKVFSQGINPSFLADASSEERKQVFVSLLELIARLESFSLPLIADINGPALAGGAVLAAMADFAIVDEQQAKICFSEVKVGVPVPYPIFSLLKLRSSPSLVNEMLVLGKNLKASEMISAGLAQSSYSDPSGRQEVLTRLVGRIQRLDPRVLAATLEASRHGLAQACRHFLETIDESFTPFLSDDRLGYAMRQLVASQSSE